MHPIRLLQRTAYDAVTIMRRP